MSSIIILSHQGGSFVEKLRMSAKSIGLDAFVISSEVDEKIWADTFAMSPNAKMLPERDLSFESVKCFIDAEFDVSTMSGFISVWEGYRPLMGALNAHYGFNDISEDVAYRLRDKYAVRDSLKKAALSAVDAEIVNKTVLEKRLNNKKRSFIKPRFGLGSVGAKELKSEQDITYIQTIRKELSEDKLLAGAVGNSDFIVEDFVDGVELSAEVLVEHGRPNILAYHEKAELRHGLFTTTEPFCVSPPLTTLHVNAANTWLCSVMDCLGATHGCYHIEFKVTDGNVFELIEINPRVGGALIIESTNFIADMDFLARWIASLSQSDEDPKVLPVAKPLKESNAQPDSPEAVRCTAFRVYFSQMCGTVDRVNLHATKPMPSVHNLLVNIGQELTRKGAEQYLGQALWTATVSTDLDAAAFHNHVQNISESFLKVDVRPTNALEDVCVIIDYNLNRANEVIEIAEKCFSSRGVRTVLMTQQGKAITHPLIINALFKDVRSDAFKYGCVEYLSEHNLHCVAGLVFSDDAIVTGSYILSHLGVWTDSPELAVRSFDKLAYREAERRAEMPEGVACPNFITVSELNADMFDGDRAWIIKPRCEGNNRGVIKVSSAQGLLSALELNQAYHQDELLAEQCIDIAEEYSVDGVGSVQFVTKKLTLKGQYPLEIGQVQPAILAQDKLDQILAANVLANQLTGQCNGAFHNEVMICSHSGDAYIVEPNRRPGGMEIWRLIQNSYGIDLYDAWVHSAYTASTPYFGNATPKKRSGFLMLPGPFQQQLNRNEVLAVHDDFVEFIWSKLELPAHDRPPHSHPTFIAPEGYIFPQQPVDGHGFMLSLRFEAPMESDLEQLLRRFFETWSAEISKFMDTQRSKAECRDFESLLISEPLIEAHSRVE